MSAADGPGAADDVRAAEQWFVEHGLPWFVEDEVQRVSRLLAWRPVLQVLLPGAALAVLGGVAAGLALRDVSSGLLVAMLVLGALFTAYAATVLRVAAMARWASGRAVGQLSLLLPLVTRALPLLLLFTTFLFINTEVWMVASALDRPTLWIAVMLFAALAAGFLLASLPEELHRVSEEVTHDGLPAACRGTPLQARAEALADRVAEVPLSRLQRANLLMVLLVTQAIQVLLLSLAVFGFFVVFGVVAIERTVVESWLGHDVHPLAVPGVTRELFQVAVFLAAFSGLYFTVYAVTDRNYRERFFTQITGELERAVGVRGAYLALRGGTGDGAGRPVGPPSED